MEILVFAKGGPASGKTYMLGQIEQLLEDMGFSVKFPDDEHTLEATRSDDWVKENVK